MKTFAARLHIIAAKEAPFAVIIRRKPSKQWHIMLWNLENDEIRHGSWFTGTLYPMRSDISWDGRYMSYLAIGATAKETWNGICELPFLKTAVEWGNTGAWNGGAVWLERNAVYRNLAFPESLRVLGKWPSKIEVRDLPRSRGEDLSILFYRLYRDGFRPQIDGRAVEPFDKDFAWKKSFPPGHKEQWRNLKSARVAALTAQYIGYKGGRWKVGGENETEYENRSGYVFRFDLEGFPNLLGPRVEWATWASTGDLLYAMKGSVFRLTPHKLLNGYKPVSIDLNDLERPRKLVED